MQLTQDLGIWSYLLLAILVMIEGPVATLAGAVAASAGWMKPTWVFVSAATGNVLADTLWYTLGYVGKIDWLHRYGRWFGLREDYILQMMKDIQKHVKKLLFIAKLTLGFTIPTLIATGLARVPIRRWLWVLLISETIWTGSLVFVGFHFGRYVQRFEQGIEIIALVGALFFVFLIIAYLSHLRKKSINEE